MAAKPGTVLKEIRSISIRANVRRVPLFRHEVLGLAKFANRARVFGEREDPAAVNGRAALHVPQTNVRYEVASCNARGHQSRSRRLRRANRVVLEVGTVRRHVGGCRIPWPVVAVPGAAEEGMRVVIGGTFNKTR